MGTRDSVRLFISATTVKFSLRQTCQKLSETERRNIAVVSLGDEIGLPAPDAQAATEGFVAFLKAQSVAANEVNPVSGGDWSKARQVGKGEVRTCGFLPGLTYFHPAIPRRPVDRGTTDDSMAHFVPTQFDPAAGRLIGSIAENIVRPVTCSQPLVEASLIESPAGSIIVLANWSGQPVRDFVVTANIPLPARNATLASGAKLTARKDGQRTAFTFDLDVADVLILR